MQKSRAGYVVIAGAVFEAISELAAAPPRSPPALARRSLLRTSATAQQVSWTEHARCIGPRFQPEGPQVPWRLFGPPLIVGGRERIPSHRCGGAGDPFRAAQGACGRAGSAARGRQDHARSSGIARSRAGRGSRARAAPHRRPRCRTSRRERARRPRPGRLEDPFRPVGDRPHPALVRDRRHPRPTAALRPGARGRRRAGAGRVPRAPSSRRSFAGALAAAAPPHQAGGDVGDARRGSARRASSTRPRYAAKAAAIRWTSSTSTSPTTGRRSTRSPPPSAGSRLRARRATSSSSCPARPRSARAAEACAELARHRDLLVLPLHGDLPADEQDRALEPARRRKVILATNVAETSDHRPRRDCGDRQRARAHRRTLAVVRPALAHRGEDQPRLGHPAGGPRRPARPRARAAPLHAARLRVPPRPSPAGDSSGWTSPQPCWSCARRISIPSRSLGSIRRRPALCRPRRDCSAVSARSTKPSAQPMSAAPAPAFPCTRACPG